MATQAILFLLKYIKDMCNQVFAVRKYIHHVDTKRNAAIPEIARVLSFKNLRYEKGSGHWHLLDVYRPEDDHGVLPVLVVVHGGGWIYGDKEIYRLYAADLARRGFAVVCFNYALAPEEKFPSPLESLDRVLSWIKQNEDSYAFDLDAVALVGDSAGAQIASQYAAIVTNPAYAKHFDLTLPLSIKALGLNCGVYRKLGGPFEAKGENFVWPYYLGRHFNPKDPRYETLSNITESFPPCYVMTAEKDFVKGENPPLLKALDEKKIPHEFREFRNNEGKPLEHVFHLNIIDKNAILANDDECCFLHAQLNEKTRQK